MYQKGSLLWKTKNSIPIPVVSATHPIIEAEINLLMNAVSLNTESKGYFKTISLENDGMPAATGEAMENNNEKKKMAWQTGNVSHMLGFRKYLPLK